MVDFSKIFSGNIFLDAGFSLMSIFFTSLLLFSESESLLVGGFCDSILNDYFLDHFSLKTPLVFSGKYLLIFVILY